MTEVINRFQMIRQRLDMLTGVTTNLDVRMVPFSKVCETANRLQPKQVRISKLVEPGRLVKARPSLRAFRP